MEFNIMLSGKLIEKSNMLSKVFYLTEKSY